MKSASRRLLPFAFIAAVLCGVTAIALATPPSGQHPSGLTTAALEDTVRVNADRIKFQTKDPTDVSTFTVTYDPGGSSGWHTHPGVVLALVQSGAVVRQVGCTSHTYSAGQAFVESDEQPSGQVRNASVTDPAVLTVAQIVPRGSVRRNEAAPPSC